MRERNSNGDWFPVKFLIYHNAANKFVALASSQGKRRRDT